MLDTPGRRATFTPWPLSYSLAPQAPCLLHHYVVVRSDLPRGFLAAQVVHAAGESSPGGLPEGTFAIVLAAIDEAHLRELQAELHAAEIGHVAVHEPDAPWCGAMTAIGLVPVADRKAISRVLGRLPLLK